MNGNVISEFDYDIDTGEVVKVYKNEGTPNPIDDRQGDPTRLSRETGGRLGNQEARTAVKGVGIAAGGGGAAGPISPEGDSASGVLLTPEERANAERLLNVKAGGGVTDPANGVDPAEIAVTDRDLKDMHLRGNGGAKGPTQGDGGTGGQAPSDNPMFAPGVAGPAPRGAVVESVAPVQVAPNVSGSAVQEVQKVNK